MISPEVAFRPDKIQEVEKKVAQGAEVVKWDKNLDKPVFTEAHHVDVAETCKSGGGSYREVCKFVKENGLENKEVHHIPADSASPLERMDGPCIMMDKEDHRMTASCGNSKEAQEYRAIQKELIDKGDFESAMKMDIEDIRDKFGSKYDAQIDEMLKYFDKIKETGNI